MPDPWIATVEAMIASFASVHRLALTATERSVSASFEIGCFHALLEFYRDRGCRPVPQNLTSDHEYAYLTSPNGNPANFSYVLLTHGTERFHLRQQVRVRSHLNKDIAFAPDLVVIPEAATISSTRDSDYARGRRSFFSVDSTEVIAAHECKSMPPFPELLVSFIGMLVVAHSWLSQASDRVALHPEGIHLAPTLFVGGSPRALHTRMVKALQECYPINIILGVHSGTWNILSSSRRLNLLPSSPSTRPESATS